MDPIKNCSNCKHHVGKKSIDDVANECFSCVHHRNTLGYYPLWEPTAEAEQMAECGWQGGKIVYKEPMNDNVNSPKHYTTGGIETIDFIVAKLGMEGAIAYCLGNVMKYVTRWKDKGGLEDLKKAQWYLEYAINLKEQQ